MNRFACFLILALLATAAAPQATPLRVKVFPGAQALPQIAAVSQGIFERHGLKVELAKHDVVIVTGGDSSMNEFFVQPEVRSFADLKGRTRRPRNAPGS